MYLILIWSNCIFKCCIFTKNKITNYFYEHCANVTSLKNMKITCQSKLRFLGFDIRENLKIGLTCFIIKSKAMQRSILD